jgi:hypothetical protein
MNFNGIMAGDVIEVDPQQAWPVGIAGPYTAAVRPAERFYCVESAEPGRLRVRPATAAEIAAPAVKS